MLLLLAGIVLMSKLPETSVPVGPNSPANGKSAPDFDLIPLTDETILARLADVPNDKVVLLHFWGTWCGPCKMEYPALDQMVKHWEGANGFQFVPVSCESSNQETLENLKQKTEGFFQSVALDSYAYCDPRGITRRSVAERLERDSMFFPTTVLIKKDGSIAGVWEGFNEGGVDQMHEAVSKLMQQ